MRRQGSQDGGARCSFCGKSQDEVNRLIAGPTVYICDECVHLCHDAMLEESVTERGEASSKRLLTLRQVR